MVPEQANGVTWDIGTNICLPRAADYPPLHHFPNLGNGRYQSRLQNAKTCGISSENYLIDDMSTGRPGGLTLREARRNSASQGA